MTRVLALALALLLALALAPGAALAADGKHSTFPELEKKLMCVQCNVTLNIAESAQADSTRAEVKRLMAQGLTDDQVLDQLVDDYGPNVLAEPKAEGFNLLAYVIPVVGVLALVAAGLVLLPRWRRGRTRDPGNTAAPARPELDARDARRLDAELAAFDR